VAFGLFSKPEEPLMVDANEGRLDKDIHADNREIIDNAAQLNAQIMHTDKMRTKANKISVYHAVITKEFKTSFINAKDIPLYQLWQELLDTEIFLDLEDVALQTHAELLGSLGLSSSVDGKERKAEISVISNVNKTTGSFESQHRKLL
jgi:hypothetical protein